MTKKHYITIDIIKAILIILVYLGHIIPGSTGDTFSRYIIYSFHMPLFVGISGFLLKSSAVEKDIVTFINRYSRRIIIPWLIAVMIYSIYNHRTAFSLSLLVKDIIYPYYHLWFVVGYMFYTLIVWLCWQVTKNSSRKMLYILTISVVFSIMDKFDIFDIILNAPEYLNLLEFISNTLRLRNSIFFSIGFCLRELYVKNIYTPQKNRKSKYFVLTISSILIILSFNGFNIIKSNFIKDILFFVFNISLIIVIIDFCINYDIHHPQFEFIGRYSLPIYLYHIIFIYCFCTLFNMLGIDCFGIKAIAFIPLCICIYIASKISFINQFIFGTLKKQE